MNLWVLISIFEKNHKEMFQYIIQKIKTMFSFMNSLFHDFGFDSLSGFIKESLFLSPKYMNIYLFSFTASAMLTFFQGIISRYIVISEYFDINIYNPSKAIILLFIITIADIWLGTTKAVSRILVTGIKEKEEIQGNKLIKSFSRFSVQVFFVSFLFNLSNLYGTLNVEWVVHSLMIAFIVGTFISAWNNAFVIGWLDKEVHGFILAIFDLKKVFYRFNKRKQDIYDIEYTQSVKKAAEKMIENKTPKEHETDR
jgi:hypothetical protein